MLSHLASSWLQSPANVWYALLGLVNVTFLLDMYVDYRQHLQISLPKRPTELAPFCTEEEYEKSREYGMDSSRFNMISKSIQHILAVVLLFSGAYLWLWALAEHLTQSRFQGEIAVSLIFQGFLFLYTFLTSLPFGAYKTFYLERRHGFNKTTVGTFVGDQLKGGLLTAIFGSLIVGAIIWIIRRTGGYFAIAICIFLLAFQLIMVMVYPTLIQPLFNKFTPIAEDSPVKAKIETLAAKVGFPLTKIYVMDGSRRSSHSNAYFFGFMKNKRIVLFDTLLEQVSVDEITSIVGHELGHWYHNHMLKGLILLQVNILTIFLLFQLVMNWSPLYAAFGFAQDRPVIIGLTLFQQLLAPLGFVTTFLMSYASRSREFEADRFAIDIGYGESLPPALLSLYRENKNFVHPDWLYSALHHSHPPPSERISAMHHYLSYKKQKSK